MIKWLMGVAAKLHPQSQCFSQQQVEDALLDVKVHVWLFMDAHTYGCVYTVGPLYRGHHWNPAGYPV